MGATWNPGGNPLLKKTIEGYNMNMQNQPQPNQQPVQPNPAEDNQVLNNGEKVTPVSPEVVKAVEASPEQQIPKEPSGEVPSAVNPAPVQPQQPVQTPSQNQPISDDQVMDDASDDKKEKDMEKLDKRWVDAVGNVIDEFEDKPFEEEEKSEDVQIKYLDKRFGRKLEKSQDE